MRCLQGVMTFGATLASESEVKIQKGAHAGERDHAPDEQYHGKYDGPRGESRLFYQGDRVLTGENDPRRNREDRQPEYKRSGLDK